MIDHAADVLLGAADVCALIESGAPLLLAGQEEMLATLPRGVWVGGTIPYFMTPDGGADVRDRIFVTRLPDDADVVAVKAYDASGLAAIPGDEPEHGFSYALIPAFSAAHKAFAEDVYGIPGFFERPLLGWVARRGVIAGAGVLSIATIVGGAIASR